LTRRYPDTVTTAGRLLVATPELLDPNFARSVVLIVEHQPFGAIGVILNRPDDRHVGDVLPAWEQRCAEPSMVFDGGPVERGGMLAVAANLIDDVVGWSSICDGVSLVDLSGDPDQIPDDAGLVRIFSGYAGWGPDQLDLEIEEGAWWVVDVEPSDVSVGEPDGLWRVVVGRQGGRMALLRDHPDHPSLN
jgi:putative transcriptional regulator